MSNICGICQGQDFRIVYEGNVRDGVFGKYIEGGKVAECQHCGARRLDEACCIPDEHYETQAYREKLQQQIDGESFLEAHDSLQKFNLRVALPFEMRGKTIADIGCGAGSFLDHVTGLASEIVAVEPFAEYQKTLEDKGYRTYSYAREAASDGVKVDMAFSFQVIEHVTDPVQFLREIREILKPGAQLVVSTPNRNDILMELLPETFPSFFYRVVHRWYFDSDSLAACARIAGFNVIHSLYVHRYGLANTLYWLREGKPRGFDAMAGIDQVADQGWMTYLEDRGKADTLFMVLQAG
jgi:SAM-dependent methyltransferase